VINYPGDKVDRQALHLVSFFKVPGYLHPGLTG